MDFELPKLADTLVEGTISRWLKKLGEPVRKGEPLVEVETDKVNSELESPADGVLAEILAAEGATVPVGEVIARIATEGSAAPSETAERAPDTAAADRAGERLADHLLRSASAVPQGVCVREVPATAIERLAEVASAAASGVEVTVGPPSTSDMAMPALQPGQPALVVAGAERDGHRLVTLCYDRRVLDDWAADQLLGRIASQLT